MTKNFDEMVDSAVAKYREKETVKFEWNLKTIRKELLKCADTVSAKNSAKMEGLLKLAHEKGIDINDYLESGETILTEMCTRQVTPAIFVLTKHCEGIDVNKPNRMGKTPIECCSYHRDIKYLEDAGAINPFKQPEPQKPCAANFTPANKVMLATLLARSTNCSLYLDGGECLHAWCVVNYLLHNSKDGIFDFAALCWLYEKSTLVCHHDRAGDTDEKCFENHLQHVAELQEKGYNLYMDFTTDDIKEISHFSFHEGFRVPSDWTHVTHEDGSMTPNPKCFALLLPKDEIPTSPLEECYDRMIWC